MRLLAAALLLALIAATPTLPAENLRIATTGDYPPFNHVDNAGEIAGYDVDIARALCTELGVECEIVLEEWSGRLGIAPETTRWTSAAPRLRATASAIAATLPRRHSRRQTCGQRNGLTENVFSNVSRVELCMAAAPSSPKTTRLSSLGTSSTRSPIRCR